MWKSYRRWTRVGDSPTNVLPNRRITESSIFGSPTKTREMQKGGSRDTVPFIYTYVGTFVMAGPGAAHALSHNARDALCMLHTLLTIRKITVGPTPSLPPPRRRPSLASPRTSEYVYERRERARFSPLPRERINSSAKARRSTRLSRRRRIIFLSPR